MEEKFKELRSTLATLADIHGAEAILGWDAQTYMPPGSAEARGRQSGTLGQLAHEIATSEELGRLLEDLRPYAETLDPDSDERRMIRAALRDYDRAKRIPAEFVREEAEVTAVATQAWVEARQKSDFNHFSPHLEKMIEMIRRRIGFFPPTDHPYDILLDAFEPEMKTVEVKSIFDGLRTRQVQLIQAISRQPQVDDSFLHQAFDEGKQWQFGVEVVTAFGFDWKRGRQDRSPHPFTNASSRHDVRITTRVAPTFLNTMLFGNMHETGHALYALGSAPSLDRTNLEDSASQGVSESQSRMWENLVGRSRPFWDYFYPRLQKTFPGQLENIPADAFYRGINKVQPSPIRVEADEATYNLHIMLRLEIEIAIIEGKVAVKDLPTLWNSKMEEYLGIAPRNDAEGVLQDIHWSWGMFGYFPTYTLGNIISAQLWEKIERDLPDLEEQIRVGRFDDLLEWLQEKIYRHGRKFLPQELVQRVTGSKINPAPYLRYLEKKYGEIYGLGGGAAE